MVLRYIRDKEGQRPLFSIEISDLGLLGARYFLVDVFSRLVERVGTSGTSI